MSTAFSRLLTLLRKERGISQKEAAAALQVSQALLSHYEKGIRECGLDFVVRVADFYQVSCDYLLGRTADKSGAMIAVEEIPEKDPGAKENQYRGSVLPVLNKKLTVNSLSILYDLLQRMNNKALTTEVSSYLALSIYAVFRQLYVANPKNPAAFFSLPAYLFQPAVIGELGKAEALIGELAADRVSGASGTLSCTALDLTPDRLSQEYPLFASSLQNLLRNAEQRLTGKNA